MSCRRATGFPPSAREPAHRLAQSPEPLSTRLSAFARIAAVLAAAAALALPSIASAWESGSDGLKPVPPLTARVTDLTGTLSPPERASLEAKLAALESSTGAQVGWMTKQSTLRTFSRISTKVSPSEKVLISAMLGRTSTCLQMDSARSRLATVARMRRPRSVSRSIANKPAWASFDEKPTPQGTG